MAAAARTWPSSRSCCPDGARTSGEGTVRAATEARPSVTAAEAAQTPRSISSSLVAQPRAATLAMTSSRRAASSGSDCQSGAR